MLFQVMNRDRLTCIYYSFGFTLFGIVLLNVTLSLDPIEIVKEAHTVLCFILFFHLFFFDLISFTSSSLLYISCVFPLFT